MCRYGFKTYKTHFVCFDCRKSFKHQKKSRDEKHPCPQCKKEMADMGMDFKAPKSSKTKEWEIARGLYSVGHRFQTCGCYGPGFIPNNKEEYKEYLTEHLLNYKAQLNHRPEEISNIELQDRLNYWNNLVSLVQLELSKLETSLA